MSELLALNEQILQFAFCFAAVLHAFVFKFKKDGKSLYIDKVRERENSSNELELFRMKLTDL